MPCYFLEILLFLGDCFILPHPVITILRESISVQTQVQLHVVSWFNQYTKIFTVCQKLTGMFTTGILYNTRN